MVVHSAVGGGGVTPILKCLDVCVRDLHENRPILKNNTLGHNDIIHVNNPYP